MRLRLFLGALLALSTLAGACASQTETSIGEAPTTEATEQIAAETTSIAPTTVESTTVAPTTTATTSTTSTTTTGELANTGESTASGVDAGAVFGEPVNLDGDGDLVLWFWAPW